MKQQELLGMLQQWQGEVITSDAKFKVMACSRQIGKSVTLRTLCYLVMMNKPNAKVLYCANTIPQVKEVGFLPMFGNPTDMLFPEHVISSVNKTELSATLINGSRIIFRGTESLDKLRGLSGYDLIVLDEFQSMPRQVFTILQPVISQNPTAQMVIAGTPKGHNHFYTVTRKGLMGSAKKRKNWRTWIVPITAVNLPNSTPEAILEAKSAMSRLAFEQEYMVSFQATEGLVYADYDERFNQSDKRLDLQKGLFIGIDFNVGKMCAVVGQKYGNEMHIVEEVVLTNTNTQKMANELRGRYNQWLGRIHIYPDASGKANRSSAGGQTDISILHSAGFQVHALPSNPLIVDRVNAVNRMFLSAADKRTLFISPRCVELRQSLLTQVYDKYGKPQKEHGEGDLSGPVDALGYLINHEYPITKHNMGVVNLNGYN